MIIPDRSRPLIGTLPQCAAVNYWRDLRPATDQRPALFGLIPRLSVTFELAYRFVDGCPSASCVSTAPASLDPISSPRAVPRGVDEAKLLTRTKTNTAQLSRSVAVHFLHQEACSASR